MNGHVYTARNLLRHVNTHTVPHVDLEIEVKLYTKKI